MAEEVLYGFGGGWAEETWNKYLHYMCIYGNCFVFLNRDTGKIRVLSPEEYQAEHDGGDHGETDADALQDVRLPDDKA